MHIRDEQKKIAEEKKLSKKGSKKIFEKKIVQLRVPQKTY